MTFNFYVRAENLQIQGKENANQLRVELVNLAPTNNLNDSVAPVTKNKMNKMASKLSAPATMKAMKKTTPWPITIYTVYLNSSIPEGPYVSYLNTQIATVNDELKNIKTLLNFYRRLRRYFRTCCQQTSTRDRQHKTRINWINPQQLVVDVGEWVVCPKKGAKKVRPVSCHIPLLINKKCTPFPYSNRTFQALWEGRERTFMLKVLNLCKTIRYAEYTCIFTNKKGYLLVFFVERVRGNTKGRGPLAPFSSCAHMHLRNFSLRLKLPAPAMQVIGEQAADAAP